ncbi:MAG: copper chaperone PCu(A)C [Porticoccaceae bacterium]|nr:copper chaperone PCu(A)C [Porticoccaceae bacterium]
MKKTIINSLLFGLASSFAVSLAAAESLSAGGLRAEGAYIRAMPPGQQITAAFLKLTNSGEQACKIIGGSSPIATDLQIHEHQHSNGMMKMRPLESVAIEAGQILLFQPGQLHLMLFGINQTLVPGQQQEFTLTTEDCGSIVVAAEVRSLFKRQPVNSPELTNSPELIKPTNSHEGHNHHDHSHHNHHGHSDKKMQDNS